MNIQKITTSINYLICEIGEPLSKTRVVKLLYFIDKEHFKEHGSIISGDTYSRWQYGPIPLNTIKIIDNFNTVKEIDYMKEYLKVVSVNKLNQKNNDQEEESTYKNVKSRKEPDLDELSEYEIETINKVVKKYGKMRSCELSDLTHEEDIWKCNLPFAEILPVEFAAEIEDEKKKIQILGRYKHQSEINQQLKYLLVS